MKESPETKPYRDEARRIARNDILCTAADLLLILPLLIFIAFWNLETPSIHFGDEAVHVRVTQEMLHGGSLWHPHSFDRDYFNKPPLKMWLSIPIVALLGEGNYGYRFPDALAGVLTGLIVYFFGRALFLSRVAAVFSVIMLFGCKALLFFHGVRSANQDSAVVFFVTAAIFFGWQLVNSPRAWGAAVGGGIAVGCAVLTKNVIGFLPFFTLGLYLLLRGDALIFARNRWKELLSCIGIGILLPALYVVPKCAADSSVCLVMVNQEVINRVSVGYHNTAEFWFYFRRLFQARMTLAPEVFVVSILFGLYQGGVAAPTLSFSLKLVCRSATCSERHPLA